MNPKIDVVLTPELKETIDEYCAENKTNRMAVIRLALANHFAESGYGDIPHEIKRGGNRYK